jgi:NAD(P)-dependent dehydrogenase (short-subunit alcohol dehydrogenase family)
MAIDRSGLGSFRKHPRRGRRPYAAARRSSRVPAARRAAECASAGHRGGPGYAEGCAQLTAQLSEVDVLVNNLGIFEPKAFEQIPDADWLRFFEINVLSRV